MRREQKAREKLMKGAVTTEKLMARAYLAGKNEGLELATAIIFLALHENNGFGHKRLTELADVIGTESLKMDEDAIKFNVDYYIHMLHEKVGISIVKESENEFTKLLQMDK